MTAPDPSGPTGWLADTHAHLYSCFPVQRYLDSAIASIDRGRRALGAAGGMGCLLIAETAADRSVTGLMAGGLALSGVRFSLRATSERNACVVTDGAVPRLVLIRGRQVVTAEGLEVLVFGAAAGGTEDGQSAATILEHAAAPDSIAIVPWGFGKWWFARGRVLRRLIIDHAGGLALGDNGGRPSGTPRPPVFDLAEGLSVPVLPGSDPLPLGSEVSRAGSYGAVLPCTPDLDRPLTQIVGLLRDRAQPRATFGGRIGPLYFAAAQARLALRRFIRRIPITAADGSA